MEQALAGLHLFFAENQLVAYLTIYILTIFLGNIAAFAGLWASFSGILGPWGTPLTFLVIIAADITGDILWYSLGHAIADTKLGIYLSERVKIMHRVKEHLQKHGSRFVFFSKFIIGGTFPVILSIGWSKYNFPDFLRWSLRAILVWVPTLTIVTLAIFSGASYLGVSAAYAQLEYLFLGGLVISILFNLGVSLLAKKIIDH